MADRWPDLRTRPPVAGTELVAIGGLLALGTAFVLSPDHIEDGPVLCPFRSLTGLPCPGCGLTRSWVYAAHGRWHDSFLAHPFGLVAAGLVVAVVVAVLAARVRRRPPIALERLVARRWLLPVAGAWLAFGVVRLAVEL